MIKAFRPTGQAPHESPVANGGLPNGLRCSPGLPVLALLEAPAMNGVQDGAASAPPAQPAAAAPGQATPDACSLAADGHCATVGTLALCAGHLCSAGGDAMIRIWDPASLRLHR